jgi:uncharacterized protein YktA (UPF0223 family)
MFIGSIENFDKVVDSHIDEDDKWRRIYDKLFSPTFFQAVKRLKKKNNQQIIWL